MTPNNALKHFEWKFKNHWKPTQKDVDAYNTLYKYVKDTSEKQLKENELFAKLYIFLYGEFLVYYRQTVFDKTARKELNRILDTPMSEIVERFVKIANDQETFDRMKEAGIDIDKHPVLKSDEENEREKFTKEMLEPVMTIDEAYTNLNAMVVNAINAFK
jgi:hypothetical protein